MEQNIIHCDHKVNAEEALVFLQGSPTWKKVPEDEKERLRKLVSQIAIEQGGIRLGYILDKLWEKKSSSYWQGKAKERAKKK